MNDRWSITLTSSLGEFWKVPDSVSVLVRLRVIRTVSTHPVSAPNTLLRDYVGEEVNALLARVNELVRTERLGIAIPGNKIGHSIGGDEYGRNLLGQLLIHGIDVRSVYCIAFPRCINVFRLKSVRV